MCAILLRHKPPPQKGFFAWFNRQVERLTLAFGHAVVLIIRRMAVAFMVLAILIGALVYLFVKMPTSFVPNEDQGYVLAAQLMPDAASLDRTIRAVDDVDKLFAAQPAVLHRTQINGYSLIDGQYKTNASTLFVTLKDFEERYSTKERALKENPRALLQSVHAGSQRLGTGMLIPFPPPPIPGIGTTGGFEFWIQDKGSGDPASLHEATQAASWRRPASVPSSPA